MNDPFGLAQNERIERSGVRKVFTPHAPVKIQELLFGRSAALKQLINQIHTPGAFPILFGDRGVGKTSIAMIVLTLVELSMREKGNVYIDSKRCSSKETLISIFGKLLQKCGMDLELIESTQTSESGGGAGIHAGFIKADIGAKRTNTQKHGAAFKNVTPSTIAELILANLDCGLLIIDETDAIEDDQVKYQLAEIVKLLSDGHSKFKIMLVGVAELSSTLTAGHPSIGRCAVETKLDLMADAEIQQIVKTGAVRIKPAMDFDREVVKRIAQLSGGYPYFTHLCALKCVEDALRENRKFIRIHHLPSALKSAALEAEQTLRAQFETATSSATTGMFRVVVDAASRFGSENFSAADLRAKIENISTHHITQGALNNLFKKLVSDNHARILHRVAKGTYRFSDPRMPSYVKIVCESECHYPNK
ncbi:hypothetical protein Rfer_3382 [Rhodoferax ferrireducens T118]|uniref:AAA+ ATPase domain-containing protein n=1 Tax=Albidiferax ferrireducens (strain ATCC BAA-621 / DSM 15236 / T118) TaxID=338969 RepID=Q21T12_ALBFT|nr:ATP-binding protein [Rhodoferax ferrireducens]ABD71091.1 hypothetical protein Rfer_3382 [Rhodoferax ferrireducens T118]